MADDFNRAVKWGFGLWLGWVVLPLLFLLGGSIAIIFFCCGGGGLFMSHEAANMAVGPTQSAPAPNPGLPPPSGAPATPKATSVPPQPQGYSDAGKAEFSEQGSVRVFVSRAVVEPVPLEELGQRMVSTEPCFQIVLAIQNTSPSMKISYSGWAKNATVWDGLGNNYKRVNFGFGTTVVGQVSAISLYPRTIETDVLVFEKPVATAKHVMLRLPCSNFAGDGHLTFLIPQSMWDGSNPDPLGAPARAEEERRKRAAQEAARKEEEEIRNQHAKEAAEEQRRYEAEAPWRAAEAKRVAERRAKEAEQEEKAAKARAAAADQEKENRAQIKLRLIQEVIDRGDTNTAKFRLRELIHDYPNTKGAKDAQEILDGLR